MVDRDGTSGTGDLGNGRSAVATFTIADKTFSSRLFVGTGKYSSPAVMVQAHEASGAEMITVAVRRVNISDRSKESLLDYIDTSKYFLLPNTAGCYTRRRSDPHGAARPRSRAVELGEARSDRRRADAVPRQRSADRGHARARARRVRRAARTRATIRSSAASSRTPARRRSCRSARRSAPASASRTSTTSASSASSRACRSSSTPASARRRMRRWRWSSAPTPC